MGKDYGRNVTSGFHELGIEWRLCIPIEYHAHWRHAGTNGSTCGELRIVRADSTNADSYCVHICAKSLHFGARLLVRDPPTLAGRVVHPAIARQRQLQGDPRSPGFPGSEKEGRVQLQSRRFLDAKLYLHSIIGEVSRTAASQRSRVCRGNHNALDARLENCFGARRLLAKVIARLEGNVHRRATSALTRRLQSQCFGVGLAVPSVKSFTDNGAVTNDNSADHWVRRCLTPALLGEGKRATHELRVASLVRIRIELRPIRRVLNRLVVCH